MKNLHRSITVAVIMAFAAGNALAQQFTMKVSTPTINDVAHEWMKVFKTNVEQRTGGRVKVEVYPASQLGQLPATVEGVVMGTIELTMPAVGFLIGLEPRFQVLDAAGLFDSIEHGQMVLSDPAIRKRLSSFGTAKGVEPLVTFLNGPLMLVSHKPVRTLADLTGQKIRAPGGAPLHVEPFRKLGASPLSMPLGEVLPAMQNRTIDGAIANLAAFVAFKYYDVAKGVTFLPKSFLVASGLVNRNFMKSLGPELERVVREEAQKAESLFSTWGVADLERIRKVWLANRGEVLVFSAADSRKYVDDVTSVVEPILSKNPQLLEDYQAFLEAAKKYRK